MKAQVLAHLIINFALDHDRPVSNLELQKIMYFCQLSSYKFTGRRLIDDCNFEAWKFGPVIPAVYMELRVFIGSPIRCNKYQEQETLPEHAAKTVSYWLNKWPWELVEYAHRSSGAWKQTFVPGAKTVIPEDLIEHEAALYAEDWGSAKPNAGPVDGETRNCSISTETYAVVEDFCKVKAQNGRVAVERI